MEPLTRIKASSFEPDETAADGEVVVGLPVLSAAT